MTTSPNIMALKSERGLVVKIYNTYRVEPQGMDVKKFYSPAPPGDSYHGSFRTCCHNRCPKSFEEFNSIN